MGVKVRGPGEKERPGPLPSFSEPGALRLPQDGLRRPVPGIRKALLTQQPVVPPDAVRRAAPANPLPSASHASVLGVPNEILDSSFCAQLCRFSLRRTGWCCGGSLLPMRTTWWAWMPIPM